MIKISRIASPTVVSTMPHAGSRRHREERAISTRRRTILSAFLVVLLLLACVGSLPTFARPQQPPDRIELSDGWQLASATQLGADGATVSRADYAAPGWHTIRRMPATVLEALQDDGTYPDLYYGKNLLDEVPQDLYKQDWWYRTTFTAPAGHTTYLLELPGINYRAEVWLNGRLVADSTADRRHVHRPRARRGALDPPGRTEHLRHQGHAGAGACRTSTGSSSPTAGGTGSTGTTWVPGPGQEPRPRQFVCLRPQCGHLEAGLPEGRRRRCRSDPPSVNTELPLPRTDSARLTIHTSVRNYSTQQVRGVLTGDDQPRTASRASTSSSR